jgi:hypothetical protein
MVWRSPVIDVPASLAPVAGAARVRPIVQRVTAEDLKVAAIERQVGMGVARPDMLDVQPNTLMLAPPVQLAAPIFGAQGPIADGRAGPPPRAACGKDSM